MRVKNNWKRPVRVGRKVLDKGEVADIPQQFLLQPRVQKLRKDGKLIFPYREHVEAPLPPLEAPKAAVLNISDNIGVTDKVDVDTEG